MENARVDVVDVDRSGDPISTAANSLRRELAKLSHQAAAVERTIDEHRRERAEALDRLERASEHVLQLETKLREAETEAQSLRRMHESALEDVQRLRNDKEALEQALTTTKTSTDELLRLKSDLEKTRESRDEAARTATTFEAELIEIRKRQRDDALKSSDKDAELEAMLGKLERANAELIQVQGELATVKADNLSRLEEAGQARDAAAKVKDEADRERTKSKEQIQALEEALAAARDAETKLGATRSELTARENELAEIRAEAARRERDFDTIKGERDREAERATRMASEAATARAAADTTKSELDSALERLKSIETRAAASERARTSIEISMKQLRDEVLGALARARASSPPPADEPPPFPMRASTKPAATHVSLAPDEALSLPPDAAIDEIVKIEVPAIPPPLPANIVAASGAAAAASEKPPPLALGLDEAWSEGAQRDGAVPPSKEVTARDSKAGELPGESDPVTPRPSDAPVSKGTALRDKFLAMLEDPKKAANAAAMLRSRPDGLRGIPPAALLRALSSVDYNAEGPAFEIARSWEREPLCHELIKALKKEEDAKLREQKAWLLKHLVVPSAWKGLADIARSEEEPIGVRRWLLEGLERLAEARTIGWRELGDLVTILSHDEDASMRESAVNILESLERSDEKKRLLLALLENDDDEDVLASAVNALIGVLPMELDPAVAERLLGHPSARVQKSVKDFIAKAREKN